jgi:glycosyltransferase involved in cell wall biosynthesis
MNNTGKTLIILSPGFPKDEADSTCMPFPQLFVKKLKELNPTLNIIVLAFQYPFTSEEYMWHDVRVIPFNGKNKKKFSRLITWNIIRRRLKKIFLENNVVGILSFWLGECALIGKYAAKKHHVKNFIWLLGQDAKKGNRYFSLIKPAAKNLIALSDFLADEFYRNYKIRPSNIIPPGIDINNFPATATERNIDIIGAGSLIPLKQYEIFIKVVRQLAKENPSIRTVICGDGPEKPLLQEMIDANNLSQNILLYGELSHSTVLELMQQSKVFLHPSSYEGFATVFSEALYAGAHVISFHKPMNAVFKNHHVVSTEIEMTDKAREILADKDCKHENIITSPIEATCRKVSLVFEN